MAILKQRLAKRQDDGSYVPVHLETSSDLVLRPDGTTVEAMLLAFIEDIAAKADGTHTHSELSELIAQHVAKKDNPHNVTVSQIGAASASHTHSKSSITDFPTSMPASDVPAWAKSASKPSYTASEVGAAAANHTHPAQTTISGNAGSATKLATPRTFTINLASASGASFDGTGNCTPGVTGVLPVAHGGTGTNNLATLLANAGGIRIKTGSYTGDGADSRHIELGFRAKAVYVFTDDGITRRTSYSPTIIVGGLALDGLPVRTWNTRNNPSTPHDAIVIDGTGFMVYNWRDTNAYADAIAMNEQTESQGRIYRTIYYYLAIY